MNKRMKSVFAIFDVNMKMFTDPVCFRNDADAKKSFQKMLDDDLFHGCPVEFYRLGDYFFDPENITDLVFIGSVPQRIFVEATVEDDDKESGDFIVRNEPPC